ncbi:VacB/RNase II family 3'-5' exoribonuclease [Atopobiaceae bacterium 24-176]
MAKGRKGANRRRPPKTRPKHRSALMGTIRVSRPGTAEVETAEGTFPVAPGGIREAMNGDTVGVTLSPAHRGPGKMARVQTVVSRATTTFVGLYERLDPLGAVTPLDERIRRDFFVLPDDKSAERLGVTDGDLVSARILSYPARGEAGVVTLDERVGSPDEVDVNMEAVIARHDLPRSFPPSSEKEASFVKAGIAEALLDPARLDLRDVACVTVDPQGARDYDDAVFARKTEHGYEVSVSIADVTHYVAPGSSLDIEAASRTCSVYLADRVLPMLPEQLSCDVCSLVPGLDRLAMNVTVQLDRAGSVTGSAIAPAVIRSRARLEYGQVDELLGGAMEPGDLPVCEGSPEVVAESLAALDEVAYKRKTLRHRRGSIDFASSESKVKVDAQGRPVGVARRRATSATELVEEAMLLANETVAAHLAQRSVATAFRVHEQPSPDDLGRVVPVLKEFDLVDATQAAAVAAGDPFAIEGVLERARGTAAELLVSTLLLRAMKRAIYLPRNDGHYALGAKAYCHFTSPIRRYPDMLVHRALRALAQGKLSSREWRAAERLLPQRCRDCSDGERRAAAAEHESQAIKMAEFYAGRIGSVERGVVSGCERFGLFVTLDETGATGLLPVRRLGDQWFDYNERLLTLTGEEDGVRWRLGDEVAVCVESVDVPRGRIDFVLADDGRRPTKPCHNGCGPTNERES